MENNTENYANKGQVALMHMLIDWYGLRAEKADIIRGSTNGRTESCALVYFEEAKVIIAYLKTREPNHQACENMRRKIMGMAYERARLPYNARPEQKREVRKHVEAWCKKYGYLHKSLDAYSYEELPKLVTQAEYALQDYLISVQNNSI